jgi:1-acyl-sn-glycerol-3-phosphate acyltransferase
MPGFVKSILRVLLIALGRTLSFIMFDVRVHGREHLPAGNVRPLMLIANHFSWFDAPLLTIHLPFHPAFVVATESMQKWWVRHFINLFDGISIWRGQVDREALRLSIAALQRGTVLAVFPEGGMNPENAERIARGEQIHQLRGHTSRQSGALVRGKSGAALVALQANTYILPVALEGTEQIMGNLPKLRRTRVDLTIGPVFGPLVVEDNLRGPERRARLDLLTDRMMRRIAALLPPHRRGPFADVAEKHPHA